MEQSFNLLYYVPGMSVEGLEMMPRKERVWHLKRLVKQKKTEEDASKTK